MRTTPMPAPAERARTVARLGTAALLRAGQELASRAVPPVLHVHDDARISVLLADDEPLAGHDGAVLVELADTAPVSLRQPVRGLLWITGWLTRPPVARQRELAVAVAVDRPDERLLDIGHGACLLTLTPASVVLADATGAHPVPVEQFASAEPDPLWLFEAGWLRHLEHAHQDVLATFACHLPCHLRDGRIRPLGVDRLGLRLRVELDGADHDVRLAFSGPISTPPELAAELRRMRGCPLRAARR